MKNLFDYATKELSQDAFLRWLFENGFDESCENVELKKIARELFDNFTGNEFKGKEIKELKTVAQWKKIDVSIWFKASGVESLIVIEDKTGSREHNQLDNYNKEIEKHNSYWKGKPDYANKCNTRYVEAGKIFKIYYKTYALNEQEKQTVEENKWRIFGIDEIFKVFSKYNSTGVQILDDYIEHIKKIKIAASNTQKPTEHSTELDCVKWEAYFNNTVVPELKKRVDKELIFSVYEPMFSYICLNIEKEKNAPYLEIRSRDSINGKLCLRILCYGIYYENREEKNEKVNSLFYEIRNNHKIFSQKYCKKNVQEKKQIGFIEHKDVFDEKEYIDKIVDGIFEYLKVMEKWGK